MAVPFLAGGRQAAGQRFVSLRAAASDRDGNAVAQTILRAYRVK